MTSIWAVALNTFRENRRDRVLYVVLLFAGVMIFAGIAVGELSPWDQSKVLLDVGQSVMSIAGSLIAILLGVGLITREIDRRTIYVILSKPVSRVEFLAGKVLGLTLTLSACLGVMAGMLVIVSTLHGSRPSLALAESIVALWVQLVLLTMASVFYATFSSSSALSAILSFSTWIIGMVSRDLQHMAAGSPNPLSRLILSAASWIFPDLASFDLKSRATYGIALPLSDLALTVGYGLAWTAAIFCLASVIFSRRDFR